MECLDIPDDYEFMDAELIELLRVSMDDIVLRHRNGLHGRAGT